MEPGSYSTPLVELQRGGSVRNGSGSNPVRLLSMSRPFPGREWTAVVDIRGHPGAISILFISDRPLAGAEKSLGELLISTADSHVLATSVVRTASGMHEHTFDLEPRSAFLGRSFYAQAVLLGEAAKLTNAIDLDLRR